MKLRILLLALVVAGLSASVALAGSTTEADPGADEEAATVENETAKPKGKKKEKASVKAENSCRPRGLYILKGVLDSYGVDYFVIYVRGGNRHVREYVGDTVTVMVGEGTKIRHKGLDDPRAHRAELAGFEVGDRLKVQIRRCKGTANGTMYAKRLKGRTPPPAAEAGDEAASAPDTDESKTAEVEGSEELA